jgi:hypothetical protein
MIYMKKITAVICVLFLAAFFAVSAFAQSNASSYFMLDTDLTTAGYQGMGEVLEIGAGIDVAFGIYAMQIEGIKGFTVKFEFDPTKASFRDRDSGTVIFDDDVEYNGAAEITMAEEANIMVGTIGTSPVTSPEGEYSAAYFIQGDGGSETAAGLIYLAVLRTGADFKVTDALTVKASLTVGDSDGNERFLGTRYFHVNQSVDVKPATWKEVKDQFKDF